MSRHSSALDARTANAAFNFIKEWEGFKNTVYADPRGVPALGYGYTLIIWRGRRAR